MSSDYYFTKWKRVLSQIESLVAIDALYQEQHDPTECGLVQRLSGTLAGYMAVYNQAIDCLQHNLQVQKTTYMKDIVMAITHRIMELRHQLENLARSNYQFLFNGLTDLKLTPFDIELQSIPETVIRAPETVTALENIGRRIEEERKRIEEENEIAVSELVTQNNMDVLDFWDMEYCPEEENHFIDTTEIKEKPLDEEQIKRRDLLNMILAQEKSRQVLQLMQQKKQTRELWAKELEGTARPQARPELKKKAAQMIQNCMRAYFKLKREKLTTCKREELLGLRMCQKPKHEAQDKSAELNQLRIEKRKKYESEWNASLEDMKKKYVKTRGEDIREYYRDEIRSWFYKWYREVFFLYDIPKAKQGGSTLIVNGTVPEPGEWVTANQLYLDEMKANKNKSSQQIKQEKMALKKEALMLKRQEAMKKRQEEKLLQKLRKNPQMHPGYKYPKSKQIQMIVDAIKVYHRDWDSLDITDTKEVKEKSVQEIDESNAWCEVKLTLRPTVDDDMRMEQKQLKTALKAEYESLEEEWPTVMPQRYPSVIHKEPVKHLINQEIADKMVDLAINGIYIEHYPKTKFEDFIGEPNFTGDDLRCDFVHALPFGGETRMLWWERCRELIHGNRKILLVGPRGSGKSVLVYAMATANDAILFELDPMRFDENTTEKDLRELINSVSACANAAQPSVIYIKRLERIYSSKARKGDYLNVNLVRKCLIRNLMKKFHKNDMVTIVGSVIDPWLMKTKKLIKSFNHIILMPDTTYTTTRLILNDWALNNHMVPRDLDISSLAYLLRGYRHKFIVETLERFLSPQRIVKIAVQGFYPSEIIEYFIKEEDETKVEYDKYLQWYKTKTPWGIAEQKHLTEQLEFQALKKKYAEQQEKKKKMPLSAASSQAGSVATMQ